MSLKVSKVDVWAATIKDQPGGLAKALKPLAEAKANLTSVLARRTPDKSGKGVVYVTPIKGAEQIGAAKRARFKKTKRLHCFRIEGPDRPGLGAKLTHALSEADINVRGLTAAAIGKRCVVYLTVDSPTDAAKVSRILRRLS